MSDDLNANAEAADYLEHHNRFGLHKVEAGRFIGRGENPVEPHEVVRHLVDVAEGALTVDEAVDVMVAAFEQISEHAG